jgi:NADH-quinone oxidoreductase subunit A
VAEAPRCRGCPPPADSRTAGFSSTALRMIMMGALGGAMAASKINLGIFVLVALAPGMRDFARFCLRMRPSCSKMLYLLGQRHNQRSTGEPYEGGILSEGSARVRLSAKFYLVAMFFVIFDLEAVFLFAWAVTARSLGWPAFWEGVIFVGVLAAALLYLWCVGALDWSSSSKQKE